MDAAYLAADTEEFIPARPYTAHRGPDGRIDIWDCDEHLFALPPGFPAEHIAVVAQAIEKAFDRGHKAGEIAKAAEIRRALLL